MPNYRNGFRHPWLSDVARCPHGGRWTGEDGRGHARPRRKAAIRVSPLGISWNCIGYALHNVLDLLGKYCLSLFQRVRAQQFASCLLDSAGFLTRHVIASKCFRASAPSWGLLFACPCCVNGSVVLLGLAPATSLREGAHPSLRLSPPDRGSPEGRASTPVGSKDPAGAFCSLLWLPVFARSCAGIPLKNKNKKTKKLAVVQHLKAGQLPL